MVIDLSKQPASFLKLYQHLVSTRSVGISTWLKCIQQEIERNNVLNAVVLLDLIAEHFGKETARRAWLNFVPIAFDERGRKLSSATQDLENLTLPIIDGDSIYFKISHGLRHIHKRKGFLGDIHFDFILPKDDFLISSCGSFFLIAHQNNLYCSEDRKNFELVHSFDERILRLGPSLSNAATLILVDSPIPVISPFSYIFENNKLSHSIKRLSNIQQTLLNDTAASTNSFITCCGGMQSHEVRILFPDGSWKTKFIHEEAPVLVCATLAGPVSLDKNGFAYLWENEKIIDHKVFDLSKLPKNWINKLQNSIAILDWGEAKLSLVSKSESLHSSPTPNFVKALIPISTDQALAVLGDDAYYLWSKKNNCVSFEWQLSATCAQSEDWLAILPESPLSIESDPRIRSIKTA